MSNEQKLITSLAIGTIGGFFIGNYIRNKIKLQTPLSKQLTILSDVIKQLEDINTNDISSIKEKINNIIDSINL